MKITRDTDEQVVIETKPGFISWILFLWAFIMIFFFVTSYMKVPRNMKEVYGAAFVAVFVFISYLLFTEKSEFNFNKISQQLIWYRKRFFNKKEGIVSFHNIKSVTLQNSMSSGSTPNTRVVLITDKEQIPLTIAYSGNSGYCREVAEKIRYLLQYTGRDLIADSLRQMIKDGQDIEAIKMLMAEKGLSLNSAKEKLDNLK